MSPCLAWLCVEGNDTPIPISHTSFLLDTTSSSRTIPSSDPIKLELLLKLSSSPSTPEEKSTIEWLVVVLREGSASIEENKTWHPLEIDQPYVFNDLSLCSLRIAGLKCFLTQVSPQLGEQVDQVEEQGEDDAIGEATLKVDAFRSDEEDDEDVANEATQVVANADYEEDEEDEEELTQKATKVQAEEEKRDQMEDSEAGQEDDDEDMAMAPTLAPEDELDDEDEEGEETFKEVTSLTPTQRTDVSDSTPDVPLTVKAAHEDSDVKVAPTERPARNKIRKGDTEELITPGKKRQRKEQEDQEDQGSDGSVSLFDDDIGKGEDDGEQSDEELEAVEALNQQDHGKEEKGATDMDEEEIDGDETASESGHVGEEAMQDNQKQRAESMETAEEKEDVKQMHQADKEEGEEQEGEEREEGLQVKEDSKVDVVDLNSKYEAAKTKEDFLEWLNLQSDKAVMTYYVIMKGNDNHEAKSDKEKSVDEMKDELATHYAEFRLYSQYLSLDADSIHELLLKCYKAEGKQSKAPSLKQVRKESPESLLSFLKRHIDVLEAGVAKGIRVDGFTPDIDSSHIKDEESSNHVHKQSKKPRNSSARQRQKPTENVKNTEEGQQQQKQRASKRQKAKREAKQEGEEGEEDDQEQEEEEGVQQDKPRGGRGAKRREAKGESDTNPAASDSTTTTPRAGKRKLSTGQTLEEKPAKRAATTTPNGDSDNSKYTKGSLSRSPSTKAFSPVITQVKVAITGADVDKDIKKQVKSFKGIIVDSVKDATHLVVWTEGGKMKRTAKLLEAIAIPGNGGKGVRIVDSDWLAHCAQNRTVATSQQCLEYAPKGMMKYPQSSHEEMCDMNHVLSRRDAESKPIFDRVVYHVTKSARKAANDLKSAMEAAGLVETKKLNQASIVFSTEADLPSLKDVQVPIYSLSWFSYGLVMNYTLPINDETSPFRLRPPTSSSSSSASKAKARRTTKKK